MKVIEDSDRWSLAVQGSTVDSLLFDWAITVFLGSGDDQVEIRIEESFMFTGLDGEQQELHPEGDPAVLAPVLGLIRKEAVRLDAYKDGRLELELVGGILVSVRSAQDYEPWGIVTKKGFRITSVPGGSLTIWS